MINCQINWEAVGAISSLIQAVILFISALAIFSQLRQYKQNSIESRIAGLDTAIKLLNSSDDFTKTSRTIMRNGKVLGIPTWSNIFEVIDQIVLLVDEKYTDPNLLLKLKGHELSAIGKYIFNNEIPEETRQEIESEKYKGVKQFLLKSIRYIEETK